MKVFFNEDNNHFFQMLYANNIEATEQIAKEYIYTFKDTDVTDLVINVNATVSTFDSKVMESFCDKYSKTEEEGKPVCFKNSYLKAAYDSCKVYKYDIIETWIDTLREIEISPWISVRMNDAHCLLEEPNPVKSEYFEKHPEHWRVTEKKADGYFDKCLNYLMHEVRQYFLIYISDVLDKYDIDGLELDFSREIFCFPIGMEWKGRSVICDFLRDVSDIVHRAEKKRGHKIKLSALVWETPSVNYSLGFDVYSWIREGLVDIIVPIIRWDTIWYEMPIEEWKILTEGTEIEIGAGQQELVNAYPGGMVKNSTTEMAFGQAAANVSKGADFVYLYNYMVWDNRHEVYGWKSEKDITRRENQLIILNNIGSMDKILKQNRSCVLTYSDNNLYWTKKNNRLPLELGACGEYIKISTGRISDAESELILGIDNCKSLLTVFCNGRSMKINNTCNIDSDFVQDNLCYYSFDIHAEDAGDYLVFQIYSDKPCSLKWAEVKIKPKA